MLETSPRGIQGVPLNIYIYIYIIILCNNRCLLTNKMHTFLFKFFNTGGHWGFFTAAEGGKLELVTWPSFCSKITQFAVESGKERDRMESSCFNQYDIGEHYILLHMCCISISLSDSKNGMNESKDVHIYGYYRYNCMTLQNDCSVLYFYPVSGEF